MDGCKSQAQWRPSDVVTLVLALVLLFTGGALLSKENREVYEAVEAKSIATKKEIAEEYGYEYSTEKELDKGLKFYMDNSNWPIEYYVVIDGEKHVANSYVAGLILSFVESDEYQEFERVVALS